MHQFPDEMHGENALPHFDSAGRRKSSLDFSGFRRAAQTPRKRLNFDSAAASLREAAAPLRMTMFGDSCQGAAHSTALRASFQTHREELLLIAFRR